MIFNICKLVISMYVLHACNTVNRILIILCTFYWDHFTPFLLECWVVPHSAGMCNPFFYDLDFLGPPLWKCVFFTPCKTVEIVWRRVASVRILGHLHIKCLSLMLPCGRKEKTSSLSCILLVSWLLEKTVRFWECTVRPWNLIGSHEFQSQTVRVRRYATNNNYKASLHFWDLAASLPW